MNLVARFERFIERLMEQLFTRPANSKLQPVEIGKRLVRAMEAQQSVDVEGVLVPNIYDVSLSPVDYAQFEPMMRSLTGNMESHLGRVARQGQYRMVSRPVVTFHKDDNLGRGSIVVDARLEDVPDREAPKQNTAVLPAVGGQLPPSRSAPNLVLNGQTYAVLRSPTRVGRLPDNDIVINDRRVSRHHAEVVMRGGRWLLRDVGSTNGTSVNGKVVKEAALRAGDQISLGGLEAMWEQ